MGKGQTSDDPVHRIDYYDNYRGWAYTLGSDILAAPVVGALCMAGFDNKDFVHRYRAGILDDMVTGLRSIHGLVTLGGCHNAHRSKVLCHYMEIVNVENVDLQDHMMANVSISCLRKAVNALDLPSFFYNLRGLPCLWFCFSLLGQIVGYLDNRIDHLCAAISPLLCILRLNCDVVSVVDCGDDDFLFLDDDARTLSVVQI